MELNTSSSTSSPVLCSKSTSNINTASVCNAEYNSRTEKCPQTPTLKTDIHSNGTADLPVKSHRSVTKYKCNVCNKYFSNNDNLKQHSWLHLGEKRFKCVTCSESFTHMPSLKMHQYKHTDEIFKCEICERILANPISLSQHIKRVHGIQKSKTKRKRKKVKSVKTEHKCNVCNKYFSSGTSLRVHYRKHTGEKRFKCSTCSEAFTYAGGLKIHEYKHKKEIFKCEICDRILSTPVHLKSHLENIHGIKPHHKRKMYKPRDRGSASNHQCKECLKCFSTAHNLKHHIRLHSGEKPYDCKDCEQRFTFLSALKAHQISKHENKNYVCEICDKILHNLRAQEIHMSKVHNMTYKIILGELHKITKIDPSNPPKCTDCNQELYYVSTLEKFRSETCKTLYKCDRCEDKSFTFYEPSVSKYDNASESRSEKITNEESITKNSRSDIDNESSSHFDEDAIEHMPVQVNQELEMDNDFETLSNMDNHIHADGLIATSPTHQAESAILEQHRPNITSYIEKNNISNRSNITNSVLPIEQASKREMVQPLSEAKITNRCKVCEKDFASATTLKNHMQIHTGEKPYSCEECSEKFKFISSLYKHAFMLHGKKLTRKKRQKIFKETRCQVCKKVFANSDSLKHHKRLHTGEKPYRCEICSQSFTFRSSLTAHHISKHNSKYRCKCCDIILYSKDSLQNHMHTKHDVSFECEKDFVCDQILSTPVNLKSQVENIHGIKANHKRKKNEPKDRETASNHQCKECLKCFSTAPNLKHHMRLHSGEKPYECKDCEHRFTFLSSLKSHQLSKHENMIYVCEICNKILYKLQSLEIHMNKEHNMTYKIINGELHKIIKIDQSNPPKCTYCNQDLYYVATLESYRSKTCKTLYKCEKCEDKSFSFYEWCNTQNRGSFKVYQCKECQKYFANAYNLKIHIRLHSRQKPLENVHGWNFANKQKYKQQHKGSPKNYQCKECLKCFSYAYNLKHHMRQHTGERPYECKDCEQRFTYFSTLKAHQLSKHENKIYVCEICDKILKNLQTLEIHMSKVHNMTYKIVLGELHKITKIDPSNPPKCTDCNHELYYVSTLEKYRSKTCKTLYKCDKCQDKSYTFYESSVSKYHDNASENRSEKITKKESFTKNSRSDIESSSHFDEDAIEQRPVQVNQELEMDNDFETLSNMDNRIQADGLIATSPTNQPESAILEQHRPNQISSIEKNNLANCSNITDSVSPFDQASKREIVKPLFEAKITNRCQMCEKYFASATTLKNHMRIHTGEKPYSCEECSDKFTFISSLYKHAFRLHGKKLTQKKRKKIYKEPRCQVCKKEFASSDILKHHMRLHTGEKPYCCEICSQSFTFRGSLRAHKISKHNSKYRCEFCDTILYSKDSLQNHMHTKHDVSFESEKDAEEVCDGSKPSHCRNCDRALLFVTTLRHNNINHTRKTLYKCEGCNKSFTFIEKIDTSTYALRNRDASDAKTMVDRTPTNHVITNESVVEVFSDDDSTDAQSNTGSNFGVVVIEPLDTSLKEVENLCTNDRETNSSSTKLLSKELPKIYDCFKCAICFSTSAELFFHIKAHTDGIDFDCVICKEVFPMSEILKNHVQTVHTKSNKCMGEKDMVLVKTPATELVEVYDVKHDNEESVVNVRQCSVVVNRVDAPERWNENTKEKRSVSTPHKHNVDVLEDTQDHDNVVKTSPMQYVDVLDVKHQHQDSIVNSRSCSVVVNRLDVRNAVKVRPDLHINEVVDVKQDHDNSLMQNTQCSFVVNKVNVGEAVEIRKNIHENDNLRMFEENQSNNQQTYDNDNIDDNYADRCNSSDHHLMHSKLSVGEAVEIEKNINESDIRVCEEERGSYNKQSYDSESDDNIDDNYDHSDSDLMKVNSSKFDASQNSNSHNETGLTRNLPPNQHINFSNLSGEDSNDLLIVHDECNVQNKIETPTDMTDVKNENSVVKISEKMSPKTCDELKVEASCPNLNSGVGTPLENDNNLINYHCEGCGITYRYITSLSIHLNRKHKYSKDNICLKCGKLFENESELSLHAKEKHMESRCQICKKLFSTESGLKFHMSFHSAEKPFKCTICHRGFRYLSILNLHRKTHVNASSYVCKLCPKKYTNIHCYDTHLQIVHKLFMRINKEVELTCDVCKKIFYSKTALQNHMRIHQSNKPFYCKECNKGFYHASSYKQHFAMHSKVRYNCKFCRAYCKYPNALLKHELTMHNTEMESMKGSNQTVVKIEKGDGSALFPKSDVDFRKDNTVIGTCYPETTKCEEDFNDLVKECVKLMNKDTTIYHCPRCGFKSFTPPSLMKHIQLHKDKGYNCVVCEENFKSSTDLKSHVIKHKFTYYSNLKISSAACALCAIEFADTDILARLKMHVRTHKPEKLLKCSLCDLRFKFPCSVQNHFLGCHSDKEFNCQLCTAKYTKPGSLKSHMKKMHQVKCFINGSGQVVINGKGRKHYTGIPRNHLDQSIDTNTNDSVGLSEKGFSVTNPRNLESEPIKVAVRNLDKPTDDVQKHSNKFTPVIGNESLVVHRNGSTSNESVSVTYNSSSISIDVAKVTSDSLSASETVSYESVVDHSNQPEVCFGYTTIVTNKVVDKISESESTNLKEIGKNLVSPTEPTTHAPNIIEDKDIDTGQLAIHKHVDKLGDENTLNSTSEEQAQTQYNFVLVDAALEVNELKVIAFENVKYNRVQIRLVDIGSTGGCRVGKKDNNKNSNTGICRDSMLQLHNESAVADNIPGAIDTMTSGEKYQENTHGNDNDKYISKCEICTEMVQDLDTHLKSHICIRGKNDNYKCLVCLLVFETTMTLKIHRNIHKEISGHFNCVVCRKTFKSASNVRGHMRSHTTEDTYQCLICNKIFHDNTQLSSHVFTHINKTTVKCEECGKVFQNFRQLQNHLRRKILKRNRCAVCRKEFMTKDLLERHDCAGNFTATLRECNFCGKKFASSSVLKQHIRAQHLKLEPHKCYICEQKFAYKQAYDSHMDRHLHPEHLKCEICQKTLSCRKSLKEHLTKVHHGTKKRKKERKPKPGDYIYKCDYENCNKAYTDSSGLSVHKRLHTGEKPYECKQCGEKFVYYASFKNHENAHLGVKYQCPDCGKLLSSKPGLNEHMNIHKGIRQKKKDEKVKCTVCGKLLCKRNYKSHMLIHEGKLHFTCEECGKSFSTKASLAAHQLLHLPDDKRPFQCLICSKGFISKYGRDEHTRFHTGEKNIKCKICNRAFARTPTLKNHMNSHTGEKPFKCKVCNKAFSTHSSLYTHRFIHTGQRPYSCTFCDKKFKDKSARRMHIKSHNKTNK